MLPQRNSLPYGLILGLVVPLIGFFVIQALFALLVQFGLMEAATVSIEGRRFRTICLLAICINIILVNLFRSRRVQSTLRGIVMATALWVIVWLFYFSDSLFAQ